LRYAAEGDQQEEGVGGECGAGMVVVSSDSIYE
jgi:hypothetical protein